jgi:hypothetical protein
MKKLVFDEEFLSEGSQTSFKVKEYEQFRGKRRFSDILSS